MNTNSYIMLLGFYGWTILLVFVLAFTRMRSVVKHDSKLYQITPFGEKLPLFAQRAHRAHANCYENLPLVTGVVFVAYMMNQMAVINELALVFLGLRLCQSTVHIISVKLPAIAIRFSLYVAQIFILIYWIIRLAMSV